MTQYFVYGYYLLNMFLVRKSGIYWTNLPIAFKKLIAEYQLSRFSRAFVARAGRLG